MASNDRILASVAAPPLSGIGLARAQAPELQLIYDTAPIGLAFLSPDCRYLQINQRLTEICGISVAGHLGRTVRETVPALADAVENIVRSIMDTGEPVTGVEVCGQSRNQPGERFWVTYWHPVRGSNGEIVGVNVAAEEITERKRAEAAVAASERQFHTLADSIPQLVWMAEVDGGIFWCSQSWQSHTGMTAEQTQGRHWTILLDPADTEAPERWSNCLKTGTALETEVRLRAGDGQYGTFLTRVVPLMDLAGVAYRWVGTHIDIREQKNREAEIQFIVDELSHRTKNLLTLVIAVANQTARHAGDVEQYQKRFIERLTALSSCHDLLVKDQWHGAPFGDLLAAQLSPFREDTENRIEASGPSVVLAPAAVHYLGLAFHELATNASKHGALSGPRGEVSIHWELSEPVGRIRVHWRESKGPPVAPPARRGFGQIVIERIVPQALDGKGALDFAPSGVNWTFEFPASPNCSP
jgi:PAS domain S-box-containing protein